MHAPHTPMHSYPVNIVRHSSYVATSCDRRMVSQYARESRYEDFDFVLFNSPVPTARAYYFRNLTGWISHKQAVK